MNRRAVVVVAVTGAFIVLMDWMPTPLNRNIAVTDAAERLPGSLVHGLACLLVCVVLVRGPRWAQRVAPVWFLVVLVSAVLNWWVPYVAGGYPGEVDAATFAREYAANTGWLPAWPGHPVVPDVQHTVIHLLLLASLVATTRVALGGNPRVRVGAGAMDGGGARRAR